MGLGCRGRADTESSGVDDGYEIVDSACRCSTLG